MKEKITKQLQKNKDLFAEVVMETAENYSEVVLDAMKFASTMGLSCGEGSDEKSLLNPFSNIEEEREPYTRKVKGKRNLRI